MHRRFNRKLVIGLVALAVVAFAGGAYAATQSSGPGSRQAFLSDVAKRLHVTPQQLSAALNGASIDQLQAEVKAGRLTQAQANALEQRLKNGGGPAPLPFGLRGFRAFGPRGPIGPGGPIGAGGALPAAASYLGLSDLQLFRQLAAGKSLAQIAAAKGKSVTGLEQAMTAAEKSRLDKAVATKALTQSQEQQLLKRFSSRLSAEVNRKGLGALRPQIFGRPRLAYGGGGFPVPGGGGFQPPPAGGRLVAPPANLPLPTAPSPPAGGRLVAPPANLPLPTAPSPPAGGRLVAPPANLPLPTAPSSPTGGPQPTA